jgi:5-methylthioadenosine/S-adenosylhomocysteine deaminase
MHLLETRDQRAWADRQFRLGIVQHLNALNLLSPRLTLAHCTWTRPGELELLADKGVTLAINTSSNLHLRSGLAPVAEMRRAGCRLAMGLDGLALDEDDDALREWRLLAMLHRGWGFEETLNDAQLWAMVAVNGRRTVIGMDRDQAIPGGRLAPGHAADLIILDRRLLDDDDAIVADVNPWHLIMARANAKHIHSVVSMGKLVVCDQRVTGIQESDLRQEYLSQLRHQMGTDPQWASWKITLEKLSQDLKAWYQGQADLGCC